MSTDKIEQEVAELFGYYQVFNPGLEKAVVQRLADAEQDLETVKWNRDHGYVKQLHDLEIEELKAERDAALADANDWRNRVAPEIQMLGDQRDAAVRNSEQLKAEIAALRQENERLMPLANSAIEKLREDFSVRNLKPTDSIRAAKLEMSLIQAYRELKQMQAERDAAHVALKWWTGCESSEDAVKKALDVIKAREGKGSDAD